MLRKFAGISLLFVVLSLLSMGVLVLIEVLLNFVGWVGFTCLGTILGWFLTAWILSEFNGYFVAPNEIEEHYYKRQFSWVGKVLCRLLLIKIKKV